MKTSYGLWFGVSIQTNGASNMFFEILQERLHRVGRLRNKSETKHLSIACAQADHTMCSWLVTVYIRQYRPEICISKLHPSLNISIERRDRATSHRSTTVAS